MLFTITPLAKENRILNIYFFNKFPDQPTGAEFSLIIIFEPIILDTNVEYKFAWNEKTNEFLLWNK